MSSPVQTPRRSARKRNQTCSLTNTSVALPSPPRSPRSRKLESESEGYQPAGETSASDSVPPSTPTRRKPSLQPLSTPSRKASLRSASKKSPYFPKISVSCIPFPSLSAKSFGLIQEDLAHVPYRLLIAVIFLNKTRGQVAVPVFWKVMERYPTPNDLAAANEAELVEMIGHLGLQNQRALKCISLSRMWVEKMPAKGVRYRRLHYPNKGDGKDIQCKDPHVGDEDARSAWEVAYLPGVGPYAIDSWRIFCRDELRGLATGWNGEGAASQSFEPEWRKVLPQDKELRAFLRWMWLRNGWEWNPLTGQKKLASDEILRRARKGGTAHERGDGKWDLEDRDGPPESLIGQPRGGEDELGGITCVEQGVGLEQGVIDSVQV
ncbi:MAG: Methyl-CpG-binding domain protein 4 [Pleopsidium flavum]|nr:MAG: Methyl-CpG-binding domain protein 4 [Pleopsidium flavum]